MQPYILIRHSTFKSWAIRFFKQYLALYDYRCNDVVPNQAHFLIIFRRDCAYIRLFTQCCSVDHLLVQEGDSLRAKWDVAWLCRSVRDCERYLSLLGCA
ncbi:hypothetical protein CY34DRAFT_807874 [Suillus luteus UH-Slu-Lm8-n1]|uniref:Uncharacterized protein n=1 Tax=Suillus luteus UH-Slu-Lm8-n1 TaxID=930992 RepID=A0A0D0AZK4_9AGAM|nr:hypothetical protein CY34DRAFT_807874 [Suillus luteus UH-Slu-Lm8-n1]